ncbi:MAG: prealbumin-like fold domain-containing protein [Planctomycetota bacterium]|nr:prealbumin-like fold domain-containing protein [Planctomycetota bacterium]
MRPKPQLIAMAAAALIAALILHSNGEADEVPSPPPTEEAGRGPATMPSSPWTSERSERHPTTPLTAPLTAGDRSPADAEPTAVDGAPLPEPTASKEPDVERRYPVHFAVRSTARGVGRALAPGLHLRLRLAGAPDAEPIPFPKGAQAATVDLAAGEYLAALERSEVGIGPTVPFTVDADGTEVWLDAPFRFDVILLAVDEATRAPLEGVEFVLEREEHERRLSPHRRVTGRTDTTGKARLEGLVPGEWHLSSRDDERWTEEWDLTLPGDQREQEARTLGQFELSPISLRPRTEVLFKLHPPDAVLNPSAYHLSCGSAQGTDFDEHGEARVALAHHAEPLYVKVDHPGPSLQERYLHGGLPEAGEAHLIDVGGPRTLEVDLQIVDAMLSMADQGRLYLTVYFKAANADLVIVNEEVSGPGIYEFRCVQADVAAVSLEFDGPERLTNWAKERITLSPGGRTTCLLRVEARPPQLQVLDGEGQPVPGFWVELRHLPNPTAWLDGGPTDAEGTLPLNLSRTHRNLLCGSSDRGAFMALDIPVHVPPVMDRDVPIPFPLTPTTPTYVEVQNGTGPLNGLAFHLHGAQTDHPFAMRWIWEDWKSETFQLVEQSQGDVVMVLNGRWSPTPRFPLEPGRNVVRVHDTGVLLLASPDRLAAVRSEEYGETLAAWRAKANLKAEEAPSGALRCTVPEGRYVIRGPDGAESTVDVLADRVTDLRR